MMELDKTRIFTASNADEVKVGSKVICAFSISDLRQRVREPEGNIIEVMEVYGENHEHRFLCRFEDGNMSYPLCYLVSEPPKKELKWTDLKMKDVIRKKYENGYRSALVTRIDTYTTDKHIGISGEWISDIELAEDWEKVEE